MGGPHRSGAGSLWDFDKFWVQVGWECCKCARSRVFCAASSGSDLDDSSAGSVGIVAEGLVLPTPSDFLETETVLKVSLHEADVVCRLDAEVGSCAVPVL